MLENIIETINEVLFRDKEEVQWEKLTDPNLRLVPRDTPYLFKLGKRPQRFGFNTLLLILIAKE